MHAAVTETLRKRPILKTVSTVVLVTFLSLTLQPLAVAAQTPSKTAPVQRPANGNSEILARTLTGIEASLARLEARLRKKEDASKEKTELKALRQNLEGLNSQALADFDAIGKHLKDKNISSVILARHAAAVHTYTTEMTTLRGNLDSLEQDTDDSRMAAKATKTREHLKATRAKRTPRAKLDPNNLPTRTLKPNRSNKPRMTPGAFHAAGLYSNPTVKLAALGDFKFDQLPGASDPAYLAETPDVQLTPMVRNIAQQLNYEPVKIYQYVKNSVDWVPSWGSVQGSEVTLLSHKGNAFDTASLLIALLRASGIPARYVHGTIDVPVDRFMNWAGGFTDPNSAANFASSGNVPIVSQVGGGKVVSVRMEHVWVEAAIDVYPSRGAVNKSADAWVTLDPTFKQYDIDLGTDLTSAVPFDEAAYLGKIQAEGPVQTYRKSLQAYLDTNQPGTGLNSVIGRKFIHYEDSGVLPSGAPWKLLAIGNRYGAIPSSLRNNVTFSFTDASGFSLGTASFSAPALAGKRLTVAYNPASATDADLINQYGGDLYAVPPYLLSLVPVLLANGQPLYTGPALAMGALHQIEVSYSGPIGYFASAPLKYNAGGYYALGLNLQGVNESVLGVQNQDLLTTLVTQPEAGRDDTLGQHLASLVNTYYLMDDRLYRAAAKLYRVAVQRSLSTGRIGISPTVTYLFGVPRTATPNRLSADMGLEAIQAVSLQGNATKLQQFHTLAGLAGSYSESAVFEAIHGFDAVSAVKAIQASAAQGVPVYRIDAGNASQYLTQLQLPAENIQEIQDGIAVGLVAIVPQREITINSWTGTGYILKNPITSAGLYRISGGLAGANTTGDGTQIAAMYKEPAIWQKNTMDFKARGMISNTAQLMWVEGSTVDDNPAIAKKAAALYGTPYNDPNVLQCTGLVSNAYAAAGICLDDSQSASNVSSICSTNNLQKLYQLPKIDDFGFYIFLVTTHYNIASIQKLNLSVRQTNDPLIGDIAFFKNTDNSGALHMHEGIVITTPDSDGVVWVAHSTGSQGVKISKMNILTVLNPAQDGRDYLGNFCDGQKHPLTECLLGSLFEGYGTIRDPRTLPGK